MTPKDVTKTVPERYKPVSFVSQTHKTLDLDVGGNVDARESALLDTIVQQTDPVLMTLLVLVPGGFGRLPKHAIKTIF
jgi:hypothetical protein